MYAYRRAHHLMTVKWDFRSPTNKGGPSQEKARLALLHTTPFTVHHSMPRTEILQQPLCCTKAPARVLFVYWRRPICTLTTAHTFTVLDLTWFDLVSCSWSCTFYRSFRFIAILIQYRMHYAMLCLAHIRPSTNNNSWGWYAVCCIF